MCQRIMELESELEAAMRVRPEVSALAWVDGRAGLLLGLLLRDDSVSRERVEHAAFAAPQRMNDDADTVSSTVVSGEGVQALARVPSHPEIVVIGMAPLGTNVAVLRAWLGEVAVRVGRAS